MKQPTVSQEFQNFDQTMRELLKVPHAEIKAKLEAEKKAKNRKRAKQSSAFCEGA